MFPALTMIIGAYVFLRCVEIANRSDSHFSSKFGSYIVVAIAAIVAIITVFEVIEVQTASFQIPSLQGQ